MRSLRWTRVALLFLMAPTHLTAQTVGPGAPVGWSVGSSALADSYTRTVRSDITARDYQISVALPFGYGGGGNSYPVLYAVDANAQFGTVVEAVRYLAAAGQIPDLVVIGVGYPGGKMWNQVFPRLLDLAPWPDSAFVASAAAQYSRYGSAEGSGGGDLFLRFVLEELIPLVETSYRVDSADRALYGHSLGGLFAVYSLIASPGTFHRFIIGSPELPWAGRRIFDIEQAYASQHTRLAGRLFISAGGDERQAMRSNLDQLLTILSSRRYEGLSWESHLFEGEGHVSVIPATISRGLRSVYRR